MATYSALVDSSTNVVLAVSSHVSAIVFLNEFMPDTGHATRVHYPNYPDSLFIASCSPEECPEWTWDRITRTFKTTRPSLINESLRTRARLANAKLNAVSKVITSLSEARYKVRTGIEFQETVYLTKKWQAQRFKDLGYNENSIMEYPYVLQYADFAGITLKQAADDILFKASLDDQHLANTELLRLRYFNKIRDATKPEQLPPIMEEFKRDCFINAKVS